MKSKDPYGMIVTRLVGVGLAMVKIP